jgi:AraC-like DNA-binding protein
MGRNTKQAITLALLVVLTAITVSVWAEVHGVQAREATTSDQALIERSAEWARSDPERAVEVLGGLLQRQPPLSDRLLIEVHFNLGLAYYFKEFHTLAQSHYQSSLALLEQHPDRDSDALRALQIRLYNNLGVAHDLVRNHDQALAHYARALALEEQAGNVAGMAEVHNNISLVFYSLGQHEDALAALEQAQVLIDDEPSLLYGLVLQNQAINHAALDRHDLFVEASETALHIYEDIGAHLNQVQVLYNLVLDHFDRTQDLAAAQALIEAGMVLIEAHDLELQRAYFEMLQGRLVLGTGTPEAAPAQLEQAERAFADIGLGPENFPDPLYLAQIEAHTALGDTVGSLATVQRLRNAAIERDMAAQRRAVNELKTQLEFNEQQQLLQAQTIALQAKQVRANQLMFLAIVLTLLLVAGALHYRFRMRHLERIYALNRRALSRYRDMGRQLDREPDESAEENAQEQAHDASPQAAVSESGSTAASSRAQQWVYRKAEKLMQDDRVFRQSGLTVSELADQVKTSPRVLSESINQYAGQSFNEYVNKYRIVHAMMQLEDPQTHHYTIEQVLADSGFASRSGFYEAFKRESGMTPRQYRMMARRRQVGSGAEPALRSAG